MLLSKKNKYSNSKKTLNLVLDKYLEDQSKQMDILMKYTENNEKSCCINSISDSDISELSNLNKTNEKIKLLKEILSDL